jgi:hypothetical protein
MAASEFAADVLMGGKLGLRDIAIPFVMLLQPLSPQCLVDHNKYVKGATTGMIFLSVLDKLFDGRETGVLFVPCYYERKFVEWRPLASGGGLVNTHNADSALMEKTNLNEKGIPTLPNGNQLIETAYHYVLVCDGDDGPWHQAVFPMKSTALKASRKLNSAIATTLVPGTGNQAPRFLNSWRLKTVKESNDAGIWSAPAIEFVGQVTQDVYFKAREYARLASSGALNNAVVAAESTVAVDRPVKGAALDDDDVPF